MLTRFVNDSRHRLAVALAVVAGLLAAIAGAAAAAAATLGFGQVATVAGVIGLAFLGFVLVVLMVLFVQRLALWAWAGDFEPENRTAARKIGTRWRREFPRVFKAQTPEFGDSSPYPKLVGFAEDQGNLIMKIQMPTVVSGAYEDYLNPAAVKLAAHFELFEVKPEKLTSAHEALFRITPTDQTQAARSWALA